MPAFYLVKKGGTATGNNGRVTVAPTGGFGALATSQYYDDFDNAMTATTPPVNGDFLVCSDLHVGDSGITLQGVNTGSAIAVSVDDTDMTVFKEGASIKATNWLLNMDFIGVHIDRISDIFQTSRSSLTFISGAQIAQADINTVASSSHTSSWRFVDCTLQKSTGANAKFMCNEEDRISVIGGALLSVGANTTNMTDVALGGSFSAKYTDLEIYDGTLFVSSINNGFYGTLDSCKLNASLAAFTGIVPFARQGAIFDIKNCGSTDAERALQIGYIESQGEAVEQDEAGIFRAESVAMRKDNAKYAVKLDTNVRTWVGNRYEYTLPTEFVKLSSASSNKLRFFIATKQTLTDVNCWIMLYYKDGTTNSIPRRVDNKNLAIFSAGNALTTDTGSTWVNTTTENEYVIELDTSSVPGADGVVSAVLSLGLDTTITGDPVYIDTSFEVVAA